VQSGRVHFPFLGEIAENQEQERFVWRDAAGRVVVEVAEDLEPADAVGRSTFWFGSAWL
jgi:hypothetical protein